MLVNVEKERRMQLINAGFKEFSIKGYDKASTNVIAKEAGISKALMFHYVKSKEVFFLYLIDYCREQISKEYLEKMTMDEQDIFKRLRQSYILQIEVRKIYPWIFEFNELNGQTKSEAINKKLQQKKKQDCFGFDELFHAIDESKFRKGLSVKRYKELIFWGNIGFIEELLLKIRAAEPSSIDYEAIIEEIDRYFADLMVVFYEDEQEKKGGG